MPRAPTMSVRRFPAARTSPAPVAGRACGLTALSRTGGPWPPVDRAAGTGGSRHGLPTKRQELDDMIRLLARRRRPVTSRRLFPVHVRSGPSSRRAGRSIPMPRAAQEAERVGTAHRVRALPRNMAVERTFEPPWIRDRHRDRLRTFQGSSSCLRDRLVVGWVFDLLALNLRSLDHTPVIDLTGATSLREPHARRVLSQSHALAAHHARVRTTEEAAIRARPLKMFGHWQATVWLCWRSVEADKRERAADEQIDRHGKMCCIVCLGRAGHYQIIRRSCMHG